ncbi:MAG: cobalamin-dependent protein [Candidatus Aminicenantes bacterium]|nr:MAG: cobalamin-dependent protein [Candidatus Aminicenantes bacterium]
MKPKVLFVQPNYYKYYLRFLPHYEPLVCMLLASFIKDLATIKVVDRRFESEKYLMRTIGDFKPDIVATRTHTAGELFTALRIMQVAKQINPQILTIVGGQHATLLPEDFYAPQTDIICIGPGEEAIHEIVETYIEKGDYRNVSGIALRVGEEYILTEPRPPKSGVISWLEVDHSYADKYRKHYYNTFLRMPVGFTLSSMGCPFRCTFCSLWVAARGTYRRRSPEEIAEDFAGQPYDFIHITDDNTFHDEKQAMQLLELLKRKNVRKEYLAYARADTIVKKRHIFEAWKEIGLAELVVGMEACSDDHLKYLNKKTTEDENARAHLILEEIGIRNYAHFIFMPDFEEADFDRTWKFIDELNICYPIFVPLTPVPGTPLFFKAKEENQLSTFDYGFYNLMYMVMKTHLPKWRFYKKFFSLYAKSGSRVTRKKRKRLSPTYNEHIVSAISNLAGKMMPKYILNITRQIYHEKRFNYQKEQHKLPVSLRQTYNPINYYNAPTILEMEKTIKGNGSENPVN